MIGAIVEIGAMCVALAIIAFLYMVLFSVAGAAGLVELFATRIPVLNSIFGGMLTFVALIFGYADTTPYENPFNLFETILISLGVFILFHLIQKTKVGFWFFAVIMSPFWAVVGATIIWALTEHNWVFVIVFFVLLTVLNVCLHIRSLQYRFEFE